MITKKSSDNAIKDRLVKALVVYGLPEKCVQMALAYIDGVKTGTETRKSDCSAKHTAISGESV